MGLWDELPRFSQRITDLVDGARHKIDDMEANTYRMIVPAKQQQQPAPPPPQPARRRRNPAPPPAQAVPQSTPGSIPEVRIHEERKAITDLLYERIGSVYQI